jgi:hypothetical protein
VQRVDAPECPSAEPLGAAIHRPICKEANRLMNTLKRSALAAIAGLLVTVGASAALAATPTLPAFTGPPSNHNPVVKPSQMIYTGDGSRFFAGAGKRPAKLHWTAWNSTTGLGTGDQWINNCIPSCAAGKFSKYPVRLKAYRPKKESKYFIFTRLKVTYTGKKPPGENSFTWNVSYSHGFFAIG